MSIGRRLFNLAKSELNSLLDKAGRWESEPDERGDDGDDGARAGRRLDELSDDELAAEIERRQRERAAGSGAAQAGSGPIPQAGPRAGAGARPSAGARSGTSPRPSAAGPRPGAGRPRPAPPPSAAHQTAKAYAALEVPAGSDFETVRKAYRNLMRKYHPDRHTGSAEKQKAATELAQRLTESYKLLEKQLRKR